MPISPMLARSTDETTLATKDWNGWVLEPKHDGMRAIIEITEDGVEIYSRTGKSQKGKCPHLEYAFQNMPVGTVLDGELAIVAGSVIIGQQTVPVVDFNKTMRVMGSGVSEAVKKQDEFGRMSYLIFDVIQFGDIDYRGTSQTQRFNLLDAISAPYLIHNPRYKGNFSIVYNRLIEDGIEGAILKKLDTTYEDGARSKGWLKVKSEKTFDVIVSGYTEGGGKYKGLIGAIEFSALDKDGNLVYVGRCSGMTDEFRKEVSASRETGFVIEVKANEMVGSGEYRTPRHPQFVCVRLDKNPEECSREQFRA